MGFTSIIRHSPGQQPKGLSAREKEPLYVSAPGAQVGEKTVKDDLKAHAAVGGDVGTGAYGDQASRSAA